MKDNILLDYTIDYDLSKEIDMDILYKYSILPIEKNTLYILVATSDISQNIKPIISIFNQAVKFIEVQKEYLEYEWQHKEFKTKLYNLAVKAVNNINNKNENSYIINFLDEILIFCIPNNVSDIHIEVIDQDMILRLRIDGVLNQFFRFDISLYKTLSSIIKFLGNLDISMTRLPLESRFTRKIENINYDFRISTLPTIYGESIVLRILDNQNIQKDIEDIGFSGYSLQLIKKSLSLTQGMILVTGPTGSGKTTTLYSMLNFLNSKTRKIITVEDPVEYKLDGIIQVNVDTNINLDFSTILKNILRQDPDILMIGEIRDSTSLQIALQASLTGHLVIATLHTNHAIDTITRLLDLKAEPYLIASTLKMILSQRLVRVLCPHCKIFDNHTKTYKAVGCSKCNLTGYKNRQVVNELLDIDSHISKLISNNHIQEISQYAQTKDFITMESYGKTLVNSGITSLEEYYAKVSHEI